MTNKTETVSVPRELLQQALSAVEYLALRGDDVGTSNVPVADALRALLSAPAEDVRAVVEEPVAYLRQDDRPHNNLIVCAFTDPGAFEVFSHPPRPVVMPGRLREIWLFLDGQSELNGCVFGEKPEDRHNFWWRKELRAVLEELYPQQ